MAISSEVLSEFSISKGVTETDAEGNVTQVFLFNPDTNKYEAIDNDDELRAYFVSNPAGRAISEELYTNQSYLLDTESASAELRRAEVNTQNLIAEFIRQSSDMGLFAAPEVDAQFEEEEKEYIPTSVELQRLYPWLTDGLLNILIEGEGGYLDNGDIDIALANLRASEDYKKTFPGIAREDGTLRMTESEYYETQDVMKDALRGYNLNPEIFKEDITNAIAGDVSAKEFVERLNYGYSEVVNNIPAVKEVYFREYGLDLSDEALFAMFISPEVAENVLTQNILVSSIIAEAEATGASLTKEGAIAFAQAGISQERAREIYGQVATISPGLSGMTTTAIARGIAGLDTEALATIRNLQARRASMSSFDVGAATTQTGEVVGLEEV